jgi:hypothetical protein
MTAVLDEEIYQQLADTKLGLQVPILPKVMGRFIGFV